MDQPLFHQPGIDSPGFGCRLDAKLVSQNFPEMFELFFNCCAVTERSLRAHDFAMDIFAKLVFAQYLLSEL
jgi:hypothetical protein